MSILRPYLLACAFFFGAFAPSVAADLTAYTEDWAPYNYEENGKIRGISTDLLVTACKTAKLECTVELVPWARAYKAASTQPQTLAFTTARKPSREREFLWVGPILPRATWIYTRNNLPQTVDTMADLQGLRTGVVRGEAAEQDLLAAGIPASALFAHASNADVLKLLQSGAIDAMVDTEVGMLWNIKALGLSPKAVRQSFKLTDEGAYYYAINPATPPDTVKKLQSAVDLLRSNGQLSKIIRSYTAAP
jgi:polar amino acid transport system substrate-binding protein